MRMEQVLTMEQCSKRYILLTSLRLSMRMSPLESTNLEPSLTRSVSSAFFTALNDYFLRILAYLHLVLIFLLARSILSKNVLDKLEAAFAKEPLSLPPAKNIIVLDTARYQEPNPETEAIDHLLEQLIELEISPFLRKHPRSVTDSVIQTVAKIYRVVFGNSFVIKKQLFFLMLC